MEDIWYILVTVWFVFFSTWGFIRMDARAEEILEELKQIKEKLDKDDSNGKTDVLP